MTVARALGILGKTVFALGLVILLFALFQLWGTGVFEARAQQSLDNEFTELLEESSALGPAPVQIGSAVTPATRATPDSMSAAPAAAEPALEESVPAAPAAAPALEDSGTASTSQGATQGSVPTATSVPVSGSTEPDPAWLAMLYRDQGSAIARIQIPALDVDKTVVEGVRVGDLRKGPGHYPTTPLPGQAGNAAIAGHRTTYGAPFGEIDKLEPGDQIIVTTIQGQFTYEVAPQGEGHGHVIVAPHQVEVLDQNFSEHPNRLTLTACHPKRSARQRIIVVAALVGEPAPTYPRPDQEVLGIPELATESFEETADPEQTVTPTPASQRTEEEAPTPGPTEPAESPTPASGPAEAAAAPPPTTAPIESPPVESAPDPTPASQEEEVQEEEQGEDTAAAGSFGEGLDGDSDGLLPAVLWGLAALAIWFFALFVGQRWRRLPAYALSALPFLVVMFMAFWHIDRVLPSY